MNLTVENTVPYSKMLPWDLRGLGVILDDALTSKSLAEMLSILCQDFVAFIKNSASLNSLRINWEKDIKKQINLVRKTEAKLIFKIRNTYEKLAKRVHDS